MGVFISIDIPEKIQEEIVKIQALLPKFMGKKTELENLHLTLKFLGEIDEKILEKLKKRLDKIEFSVLNLKIDSIGVFSENFIRIIWLHISGTEKLQEKIDQVLTGLFDKEKRFMSHLTIARVKRVEDKKEFLSKLNKIKLNTIKFTINEFKLKKSTLTEKRPVYEDLMIYRAKT